MSAGVDPVAIRPMTAADLDEVLAISDGLKEAPQWSRAVYEGIVDPVDGASGTRRRFAWVACEAASGLVAGFAVASLVPPEGELETVGVASKYQRRGIGRRLVNEIGKNFRLLGVTKVLLEVRDSNLAARGLYRSLGFREMSRRYGYYADPIEDAVLMCLNLQDG
jgi:[ribosomal protein S18]-alanine N-acetyltransferase